MDRIEPFGIYIHVPFCRSKCPYCDFYSLLCIEKADAYVNALLRDINTLDFIKPFVKGDVTKKTVTSVYFGGGTPSFLGAERLLRILTAVKNRFSVAENAEITVEVNPSTQNMEEFLSLLQKNGVNRISLGLQSAVDEERKMLGRQANAQRVRECVELCRTTGIDNISLDVMLGIPLQTGQSLIKTLDFVCSLQVPHISAYLLKIEEGTFFAKKRDTLPLPDEDTAADFYLLMCRYLKEKGYRHYEISNFCQNDAYARHNTLYWQAKEYLGFGPGAHSYCEKNRFYLKRDLNAFIGGAPAVFDCAGGDYEEIFMLKLRLDTGIDLNRFFTDYPVEPGRRFEQLLRRFSERGLITVKQNTVSLTDEGMLLSNSVIASLLNELTQRN